MTLDKLIEKLEEIRDCTEEGGKMKVVVALQPNYPLEAALVNTCVDPDTNKLWLAVSDGRGYGVPQGVWDYEEV